MGVEEQSRRKQLLQRHRQRQGLPDSALQLPSPERPVGRSSGGVAVAVHLKDVMSSSSSSESEDSSDANDR